MKFCGACVRKQKPLDARSFFYHRLFADSHYVVVDYCLINLDFITHCRKRSRIGKLHRESNPYVSLKPSNDQK